MKRALQIARIPLHPKHPERICWGCEQHCPAGDLACGNGSERTQHPSELFGEDWHEWAESLRLADAEPQPPDVPAGE